MPSLCACAQLVHKNTAYATTVELLEKKHRILFVSIRAGSSLAFASRHFFSPPPSHLFFRARKELPPPPLILSLRVSSAPDSWSKKRGRRRETLIQSANACGPKKGRKQGSRVWKLRGQTSSVFFLSSVGGRRIAAEPRPEGAWGCNAESGWRLCGPTPSVRPPGGNIGYQLPTILHQKQEAKGTLTKKGRRKKTLPPSCPYRHGGMEGGGKTRKKWERTFLCFFSFLLFGMRENWEGKRRKKIKTASDSYPRKEGRKRRNQWAR